MIFKPEAVDHRRLLFVQLREDEIREGQAVMVVKLPADLPDFHRSTSGSRIGRSLQKCKEA
jgi:hypothetical protein